MCLWSTPKISVPSVTARDLTPSTESLEPNSPKLGGTDDWKRTNYGTQSVQIKKNNSMNNNDSISNGGWNI